MMNLYDISLTGSMPSTAAPCAATVGFFDGVHRGHRYLIEKVKAVAASRGLQSTVVTFDRHPRLVLHTDFQPRLLTTNGEKSALLSATGVDNCAVLHFDEDMAVLSAREFMQSVLRDRLNVRVLITGYDNRFGHNRAEGFDDYVRYGRELGIEVVPADAFTLNGVRVSSSVVRSFLSAGEAGMAAMCLGYRYKISGKVVGGYHEGRKMGFPTANIDVADMLKLMPEAGVYAVRASVEGVAQPLDGMMNIGTRPTFDGSTTTLEVNLFGFSGDIYGRGITVEFHQRLREERKFGSVKKLIEQLERDKVEAEKVLNVG